MHTQAHDMAMDIGVKVFAPEKLARLAAESFRKRHPGETRAVTLDARILVNFIRHELTRYDEKMTATRGENGGYEKRTALRQAILIAIAKRYEAYPQIVAEAKRQLHETETFGATRTIWRAQ